MKYEIQNHGMDHAQYFQGAGVAFTEFDHIATGAGMNAAEAYHDALESMAQQDSTAAEQMPRRPRGINAKDRVPASHRGEYSEFYWYVSIRWA